MSSTGTSEGATRRPSLDLNSSVGTSNSKLSQRLHSSILELSSRFGEYAAENDKLVFIRDPVYNWLPGRMMDDDDNNNGNEKKEIAVQIQLGDTWSDTTVIDPKYKVKPEIRVDVSAYAGNVLPLQNRDGKSGNVVSKSDLADLEHLHEAAMLYNLKERNAQQVPYLRVGDIIIATNPFQWIDGLYSERQQRFFADRLVWSRAPTKQLQEAEYLDGEDKKEEDGGGGGDSSCLSKQAKTIYWFSKLNHEPHVYETSSMAYEGLLYHGRDQAVIVTGESGAGKTETVKIVLRHLATLPAQQPKHFNETSAPQSTLEDEPSSGEEEVQQQSDVVTKVLQSNPVFEAFGNAKTLRNNNSSRFGKFTQLQFCVDTDTSGNNGIIPPCELVGTKCDTYLLEKSRVVSHDVGERGYHIFYQLLLGASEEEKKGYWTFLEGCDLHSFAYLGPHEGDALPETEDSDEELWGKTLEALALFNVTGDTLKALVRALCMVLQLGNLVFQDSQDPDCYDDSSEVSNVDELDKLADVFGMTTDALSGILTKRNIVTSRDSILVTLNKETAKETCDAFAKEIYAQIFDWLVTKINMETGAPASNTKPIRQAALLDIFGFEIFEVNRFEQLCINYANERIQQKYVSDVFNEIQTEYEREGIEVFDFSAVDNLPICELIEGRTGVVTALNEECKRPKGNDASFVFKLKAVYKEDKFLIQNLLDTPYQFGIRHFAGDVTYDSHKFVEKNIDTLPMDMIDCARICDNIVLRHAFTKLKQEIEAPPEPTKPGFSRRAAPKPGKTTVLTKFKKQLRSLLTTIAKSRTRYIRCIKPNALFLPGVMDHKMTITQLSSAGLITAVTISRETFPNTLTYELFLERFRCIAPSVQIDLPTDKLKDKDVDLYRSKLKSLSNEFLTLLLKDQKKVVANQVIYPFACGKSKVFFKSGALESLEVIRQTIYDEAALTLQKWVKSIVYKLWFDRMRSSIIRVQAWWRGVSLRLRQKKARCACILVQCSIRMIMARHELVRRRKNKAAIVIQTKWRTRSPVIHLRRIIHAAKILRKAIRNKRNKGNMKFALHSIVEKAQMDHKLKNLQLNLAITDDKGLHKEPEKLLDQSQFMLDNLSREVHNLRSEASSLKMELSVHKEKLDEVRMHAANSDAAHGAKKLESSRLHQYNKHLKEEIKSYKYENLLLKKSIKQMHESQRQQISKQNELFKSMRTSHLTEIKKLRGDFLQTKQSYGKEIKQLERDLSNEKDRHVSNVKSLEEELQNTLDTHNADLSRMFEALEATQRDDQTLKVVDEYLVSSSQEKQILELKKEIEDMKRNHAMEVQKIKLGGSGKIFE